MSAYSEIRLSTDSIAPVQRDEAVRDYFGRMMQRMDYTPLSSEAPMAIEARVVPLPGVTLGRSTCSPVVVERTRELMTDGRDDLMLCMMPAGASISLPTGQQVDVAPGDFLLTSLNHRLRFVIPDTDREMRMFQIQRSALGRLAGTFDDEPIRSLSSRRAELQLLLGYAPHVAAMDGMTDDLAALVAKQMAELATVAIGAHRDAEAEAMAGGVRAAWLIKAKACIWDELGRSDLSAAMVARALGISPRYLHRLFESTGSTFMEFVTAARLKQIHAALSDPAQANRKITDIALQAGFADIRTFNRQFRQAYAMSPSDLREAIRSAS